MNIRRRRFCLAALTALATPAGAAFMRGRQPVPPGGAPEVTVNVTPNRTSVPVNGVVQFDASASLVSGMDAWQVKRNCWVEFDFGGNTGTWAHTGDSKNTQIGLGPVAVTEMDSVGVRTVTCTITKGAPWAAYATPQRWRVGDFCFVNGNTYFCAIGHTASAAFQTDLDAGRWVLDTAGLVQNETTVQITVQAESAVWSAANTYYVDNNSTPTWPNAPAGVNLVTTYPSDADDQLILLAPSATPYPAITMDYRRKRKRVRKAAGTAGTVKIAQGAGHLGLFSLMIGTGRGTSGSHTGPWDALEDISILDLDCDGAVVQTGQITRFDAIRVSQTSGGTPTAFPNAKVDTSAPFSAFQVCAAIDYWNDYTKYTAQSMRDSAQANARMSRDVFIIEPTLSSPTTTGVTTLMAGAFGNRMAIMGGYWERANEHNLRVFHAANGVIAFNRFKGIANDTIRHAIKLHSRGPLPMQDVFPYPAGEGTGQRSAMLCLGRNWFDTGADNGSNPLSIRPQNHEDTYPEGIEDVLIRFNTFVSGASHNGDIGHLIGRRLHTFGNVRSSGAYGVSNGATVRVSADGFGTQGNASYETLESHNSGEFLPVNNPQSYDGQFHHG